MNPLTDSPSNADIVRPMPLAALSPAESESGSSPQSAVQERPGRTAGIESPGARLVRAQSLSKSPDARDVRPSAAQIFDPRSLPKRRGAVRAIGIALSAIAVVGAGAGAGCVLWRTELVPHELVRRPLPILESHRNPASAEDALAAPRIAEESSAGANRPERGKASSNREEPVTSTSRSRNAGSGSEDAESPEAAPATRIAYAGSPMEARETPNAGASSPGRGGRPETAGAGGRMRSEPRDSSTRPARGARPASRPTGASAADLDDRGPPNSRGQEVRDPDPESLARKLPTPASKPRTDTYAGVDVNEAGHAVTSIEHTGASRGSDPGARAGIRIRKRKRADHVAPSLERAYSALLTGDTGSASEAYRAVLGDDPRNRDALLGLAAVAAWEGRWDEAAGHYSRVLALDPADTIARAALIAIDEHDPTRGESRLETLLWSDPRSAYLHFNLGNVYASQSRWPEAQQSYFNAYRFDSGNADYAYNLAVSLDHLARPDSALDFYREALALARSRPAGFETAAVLARIREMDSSPEVAAAPASGESESAGATPAASVQ